MAKEPKVKDPIVDSSMSWSLSIASVLLLVSTVWAFWDEVVTMRPWKGYQKTFVDLYASYLDKVEPGLVDEESRIRSSDDYEALTAEMESAQSSTADEVTEIDRKLNKEVNPQIATLSKSLQKVRGRVNQMNWELEIANENQKDSRRNEMAEFKKGPFEVEGSSESYTFDQLLAEFTKLKEERASLIQARANATREADTFRNRRASLVSRRLTGLSVDQLNGLKRGLDEFNVEIKQIHVADVDLVDRCESCHLGARQPIDITAADMDGHGVYASHPRRELLDIHNPDELGCSPCHGGNGIATRSVEKAHGKYKHWLWPLFDAENTEAGCLQCHEGTMHVEGAPTLNRGLELFQNLGCWGCHRREHFNQDVLDIQAVVQAKGSLDRRMSTLDKKIGQYNEVAENRDSTDEQVEEALSTIKKSTLEMSAFTTEMSELSKTQVSLIRQRKRPGPNLKEIKAKLNRDWIPIWLAAPHAFREGTKMPHFRLSVDQLKAVSASIWQAALPASAPAQETGDAGRGQELFESRGCLGCHSNGTGSNEIGGTFAANLSRIGEKINYNYMVRWIFNPRQRLAPYSPALGRDLTAADYDEKGLPFEFDEDNALCPQTGEPIVNQNMTVMPSLRLTIEEARDVASYLMTQKTPGSDNLPDTSYMEDVSYRAMGDKLVRHFGCAGCHEIAGFELEGPIGTELTVEGSKPKDRLDFGLLTHDADREGWYDHKSFFQRKIGLHVDDESDPRNTTHRPDYFDLGKEKANPLEKLRMPDFHLDEEQNLALTTFLLGSVDSRYPERFYHNPKGMKKDIADGWSVIKKYNCVGCHQVTPGELPEIQDMVIYQQNTEKAPPSLVGEGFRANPEWLAGFLANPALSDTNPHKNGVRPYLDIRMPTFYLSDIEVAKLVRFFNAMATQPSPYIQPSVQPLSDQELTMARDAFLAADCLKCHATSDDPASFTEDIIAPSFAFTRERLKPDWIKRWLLDPAQLMPGTQMPTGLFIYKPDEERWVTQDKPPASMANYKGDHVELFVRYMWQFTEQESEILGSK